MNQSEINEWYFKESERLEKRKTKRVLLAIFIVASLITIIICSNLDFTITSFEELGIAFFEIIGVFLFSLVLSIIDILIHYTIFSATLNKNYNESIEFDLEYRKKLQEMKK